MRKLQLSLLCLLCIVVIQQYGHCLQRRPASAVAAVLVSWWHRTRFRWHYEAAQRRSSTGTVHVCVQHVDYIHAVATIHVECVLANGTHEQRRGGMAQEVEQQSHPRTAAVLPPSATPSSGVCDATAAAETGQREKAAQTHVSRHKICSQFCLLS